MTDKLENANCTRMEVFSFLVITRGYKELVKSRACLDEMLIHTNQGSVYIDIQGHNDVE